jgi:hypothetical protein
MRRSVRTDAEGCFELHGIESGSGSEIWCRTDGYVRACECWDGKAEPQVAFRLQRGDAARVRVEDAAGRPVPGAYVAAVGMRHEGSVHYFNWVDGRTDADGRCLLAGLRAGLPQTLLVRADGWATLVYHLPAASDGAIDAGVVKLVPPRVVRGRVVDTEGKPIARRKVGLVGANGDRSMLAASDSWDQLDMYLGFREIWTDARGAFSFGDLAAGMYSVIAYSRDEQRIASVDVMVGPDRDPEPTALEVPTDRR